MNTTGIQYSTRRHRRLTLPGPEGAIFQPHPPAQLRRRRRPRAWLRGGLGAPGGTGPGAAAGCAAATAAAVALSPHPAAPSRRRGLPLPSSAEAVAARAGRAGGGRRGGGQGGGGWRGGGGSLRPASARPPLPAPAASPGAAAAPSGGPSAHSAHQLRPRRRAPQGAAQAPTAALPPPGWTLAPGSSGGGGSGDRSGRPRGEARSRAGARLAPGAPPLRQLGGWRGPRGAGRGRSGPGADLRRQDPAQPRPRGSRPRPGNAPLESLQALRPVPLPPAWKLLASTRRSVHQAGGSGAGLPSQT